MGHLASPELHDDLDLVALLQEGDDVLLLEVVVVVVGLGPELDRLDLDLVRLLFRDPSLLAQLVLVLAVVHDSADRGTSGGRHFDQIQTAFHGKLECVARLHHSELFTVFIYDQDPRNPDHAIDAKLTIFTNGP